MYRSDLCQSRKVLARLRQDAASHVQNGAGTALTALTGAWVQSLLARPDQPHGWQDIGIGLGLAALWALRHWVKR